MNAILIKYSCRREYSERMSSCFDLNDIDIKERKYSPSLAYGQSKAMNALFACKLERILRKNGKVQVLSDHILDKRLS